MLKKLLIIVCVTIIASNSYAGLEDDSKWFSEGIGIATLENGELSVSTSQKREFFVWKNASNDLGFDNFTLKLRAKAVSPCCNDIIVYFCDERYKLIFGGWNNTKIALYKRDWYDKPWECIYTSTISLKIKSDIWYQIEIQKYTRWIKINIDGTCVISVIDHNYMSGGRIGLGTYDSHVHFDNLELIVGEKISSAVSLYPHSDGLNHGFMTENATRIYFPSELANYKDQTKDGSIIEDDGANPVDHFYNPKNGEGLPFCSSALARANVLWGDETQITTVIGGYLRGRKYPVAIELGRIAHLLQDMLSPAHTHLIQHLTQADYYEEYCKATSPSSEYTTNETGVGTSLPNFFQQTAYQSFGKADASVNGISASTINEIINLVYGDGRYKQYDISSKEIDGNAQEYLKRWIPKMIIPSDNLYTLDGIQGGLQGEYFATYTSTGIPAVTPVMTRIDAGIDFNWGDNSPGGTVPADKFSVRWTGKIQIDKDYTYTFYTKTDDGIKLWIDDQLKIDNWRDQNDKEHSTSLYLSRGQHTIKLEYYDNTSEAKCRLYWETNEDNEWNNTLAKYLIPTAIKQTAGLYRYFDQQKPNIDINKLEFIDPIFSYKNQTGASNITAGDTVNYEIKLKNQGDKTQVTVRFLVTYFDKTGKLQTVVNTSNNVNVNSGGEGTVIGEFIAPSAPKIYATATLEYRWGGYQVIHPNQNSINSYTMQIENIRQKMEITVDPEEIWVTEYPTQNFNITFTVKDKLTKEPIEGAYVRLGDFYGKTDKDGRTSFNVTLDEQKEILYWNVCTSSDVGNYNSENGQIRILDKYPPKITKGPWLENLAWSYADILWATHEPATSIVEYGTISSYDLIQENSIHKKEHKIELDELTPETIYHYRVKSTDRSDNTTITNDIIFTTTKDGVLPEIQMLSPKENDIWSETQPIKWSIRAYFPGTMTIQISHPGKNDWRDLGIVLFSAGTYT